MKRFFIDTLIKTLNIITIALGTQLWGENAFLATVFCVVGLLMLDVYRFAGDCYMAEDILNNKF